MASFNVSLADLRQDIAGVIPSDLVLAWNDGEKSPAKHAQLLAPFRARGTIASSDSAGLSQLTQRLMLAQVMKLVSEPKELIHVYGTAIGGQAIGVWAADNSQMFYPEPIDPMRVVTQMLAMQREAKSLTVQVGLGIHFGECYRIAGGLFGEQADFIEDIAEDNTIGGEIVVSDAVMSRLPASLHAFAQRRQDLSERGVLWSFVDYQGALEAVRGDNRDYPAPFDDAFRDRLRTRTLEQLATASYGEHAVTKTVAFIKVPHDTSSFLLDAFTHMSLIDLSIRRVASTYAADVVKSTGALGIVLLDNAQTALAFSRDVMETTRSLGFEARVGIASSEVFLFPLRSGGRDIAGNAVNIGSKLAEDSELRGILVDSSVTLPAAAFVGTTVEPFKIVISRVEITGQRVTF